MTRKHKSAQPQSVKIKLLRLLRPWHRRFGLLSCGFILLLVTTGVMINHSQTLQLEQTQVHQSWLLDYYGIAAPHHAVQFTAGPQSLLVTDNLLWLGQQQILEASSQLLSALFIGTAIIAIDENQLYLFDKEGHLQETQNSSTGLPQGLHAIAVTPLPTSDTATAFKPQTVWLKAESGVYQSDENLIEWTKVHTFAAIEWNTPLASVDARLLENARGAHLNWERVMLDLHSGRLFGPYAVWIWDLFAFALLLVSLSGLWIWIKHRKH